MSDAPEMVYIERDLDGWVIGDDEGEFARTTDIEMALSYARDLLEGPGTGPAALLRAQAADARRTARLAQQSAAFWPRGWPRA